MLPRTLFISFTLLACWLGMQAVHELGHVLGAVMTGAEVQRVHLHPLSISETVVGHNPRPLVVVWAGPVLGCAIPVALWGLAELVRSPGAFVVRFFAGFCLIANGLYIGIGSFNAIGDCHVMLQHGAPIWQLWLFGVVTAPAGLCLWNGLGKHFGLGPDAYPIASQLVWTVGSCVLALIILGIVLSRAG